MESLNEQIIKSKVIDYKYSNVKNNVNIPKKTNIIIKNYKPYGKE
jgi:hypothetical protein